jgi:NADPH-dependent glutamate synthase beta subunit-like oxidoreductase
MGEGSVYGRVCGRSRAKCTLGKKFEPVAIGRLERFAVDYEREHGLVERPRRRPSTGKRVAVIGSGPAGLTVAGDLTLLGHEMTVLEAFHKPGGVIEDQGPVSSPSGSPACRRRARSRASAFSRMRCSTGTANTEF